MTSKKYQFIIPETSDVFKKLNALAEETRLVVISGLPGVGKSLYINEFYHLVQLKGKEITLIQWDQARKAFETDEIFKDFPMGDGTVNNGVKLMAGAWLMDQVKTWIDSNRETDSILLIEAPLVGHRFLELVIQSDDEALENFLSSDKTKVLMPIPTKKIRVAIEKAREDQVKEDAKVWFGAKPSVMKMLWKMTCDIAISLGYEMEEDADPAYDPEIYKFVFSKVLKHRHFEPLIIDELFKIKPNAESNLHSLESLVATDEIANEYAARTRNDYETDREIDEIVENWYNT